MIFTPEKEVRGSVDEFNRGPLVALSKPTGPDRQQSLPVLEHLLIAQIPILPQLQGRQQHHDSAEA
jgi:hypothetical protein